MSIQLTKAVRVDPTLLSDDDVLIRIVALMEQRAAMVSEFGGARFHATGWMEHEEEMVAEAKARGIDGDIQPAVHMGWRAWSAKRIQDRHDQRRFDYEVHLQEHPLDDPYRRPYPSSSWAYFDGSWHALVADALDIFETDEAGRRRWVGEGHLEDCHLPDHPYYQRRRDAMDATRALPGHRVR